MMNFANVLKKSFLSILLISTLNSNAQKNRDKLVGDWKSYLDDKISFEFLRLNDDGTGVKCFGQTINGKDTLFSNDITTLKIIRWKLEKQVLVIESTNELSFNINPEYQLIFTENGNIILNGEHLLFNVYPSLLNRNRFQRSITYKHAGGIPDGYGINLKPCIVNESDLILFEANDSLTQTAVYKGFEDLIPHIEGCNNGFVFVQNFPDPSYTILIPNFIKSYSFGFGNKNFYISLNSESNDSSETSIVIYYDFDDKLKNYYFSQLETGKEKKNIISKNNLDIYKTINWQHKYEGKVFMGNSIVVAYYTRDQSREDLLQNCITSFHYK